MARDHMSMGKSFIRFQIQIRRDDPSGTLIRPKIAPPVLTPADKISEKNMDRIMAKHAASSRLKKKPVFFRSGFPNAIFQYFSEK